MHKHHPKISQESVGERMPSQRAIQKPNFWFLPRDSYRWTLSTCSYVLYDINDDYLEQCCGILSTLYHTHRKDQVQICGTCDPRMAFHFLWGNRMLIQSDLDITTLSVTADFVSVSKAVGKSNQAKLGSETHIYLNVSMLWYKFPLYMFHNSYICSYL